VYPCKAIIWIPRTQLMDSSTYSSARYSTRLRSHLRKPRSSCPISDSSQSENSAFSCMWCRSSHLACGSVVYLCASFSANQSRVLGTFSNNSPASTTSTTCTRVHPSMPSPTSFCVYHLCHISGKCSPSTTWSAN
jgi:hypothetical protein